MLRVCSKSIDDLEDNQICLCAFFKNLTCSESTIKTTNQTQKGETKNLMTVLRILAVEFFLSSLFISASMQTYNYFSDIRHD